VTLESNRLIETIYKKYKMFSFKRSLKYTKNIEDSEDYIHDTIVAMLLKGSNLKSDGAIGFFTYCVEKTSLSRTIRKIKKKPTMVDNLIETRTPESIMIERELYDRLNTSLKEIPERYASTIQAAMGLIPIDKSHQHRSYPYRLLREKLKYYYE